MASTTFTAAGISTARPEKPRQDTAANFIDDFMNEHELRELDAFCAERVLGWKPIVRQADSTYPELRYWNMGNGFERLQQQFRPTTDPAAAMQVLEQCHKQCCVETGIFENVSGSKRGYFARSIYKDITTEAPTLELAIALFAKKLFSK